ncbi:MAG: Isochorismatase hydrolase [Caulobacteraceae bacterium]|nr:Isochorismatase hydrolase [Caulobacteraceae bacterium]
MSLMALDTKTALVVIDLQKGIMAFPTAQPSAVVAQRAAAMARAFRAKGLPVVLVNVTGGAPGRAEQVFKGAFPADWADLVEDLDRQPSDHLVSKQTWGAFTNTDLEAYLRGQGVTQIVLCGIATSIGVESTARFAHELGFNIALVVDAMTDMNAEAHENSVARIFPRLGERVTSAQIIGALS